MEGRLIRKPVTLNDSPENQSTIKFPDYQHVLVDGYGAPIAAFKMEGDAKWFADIFNRYANGEA